MSAAPLDLHYSALNDRFSVEDAVSDYSRLVTAAHNQHEPVHSWFHLKEAYSSQLLSRVLKDSGYTPREPFRVLDPFSGSGTTMLSAVDLALASSVSYDLIGIERNPFLWTLSNAKLAAITAGKTLIPVLRQELRRVRAEYARASTQRFSTVSSTLNNAQYFKPEHVESLLRLRQSLEIVEDRASKTIFLASLGATVEGTGKLRRDGRALRYVESRNATAPYSAWLRRTGDIITDLENMPGSSNGKFRIEHGDARNIEAHFESDQKVDWIFFSPPYPNNIDYTEVYKLENWVIGGWTSAVEMKQQRLSTLRSHPSISFPEQYSFRAGAHSDAIESLLAPLLASIPKDRYETRRRQLVLGYFDDMYQVLKQSRGVISADGHLCYVVGNSTHGMGEGAFVIAADLLIARLGELAGWEISTFNIARRLKRRGAASTYLRESVVILRPC